MQLHGLKMNVIPVIELGKSFIEIDGSMIKLSEVRKESIAQAVVLGKSMSKTEL